ncbi:MAG: hypothetical protein K2J74_04465, partial [Muribaculaceae bacterium]|nr:hypothetical protein [Muribaculaceae bacterium]
MRPGKVIKRILIIVGSLLAAILLLLVVGVSIVLWYLTPERLTPIVEREANEYLSGAHAKIGRLEVTLWKTFPQVVLCADSVSIISEVFNNLSTEERAELPIDADTLLALNRFRAGLNIPSLLHGEIALRDVMLTGLCANVVEYSPELVNYMIVKQDDAEPVDTVNLMLPDITVNSIEISDCDNIRYFSKPQQLECSVALSAIQLSSLKSGLLQLAAYIKVNALCEGDSIIRELPINTNSYINWTAQAPLRLKIEPSEAKVGNISMSYSIDADFEAQRIDSLRVAVAPFEILEQIDYGPEKYAQAAKGFKTNLSAAVDIKLLQPYDILHDSLPSVEVNYEIPESYLEGPRHRRIDAIALKGNLYVDADSVSLTEVNVDKALLRGLGVELRGDAVIKNALIDPYIKCYIHGKANIGNLIAMLGLKLPYKVSGNIDADTHVKVRMSDINAKRYNVLDINGKMCMQKFNLSDDAIYLYVNDADLNFDSQQQFKAEDGKMRNLLGGNFALDSLRMDYMGENLTLIDCSIKGAANPRMASLDGVHPFIPFGMKVEGKAIRYRMADSTFMACSRASAMVKVIAPPYKATKPGVGMDLNASRVAYFSKDLRGILRKPSINLELMPHRKMQYNPQRRYRQRDSIKYDADSETLRVDIDSATRRMLRNWQLRGSIITDYARVITPYFPLANSLSNLNIGFNLDSINIISSRFRSGVSDMAVTGGVYNIRSTLLGRSRRRPLTVNLELDADTLDANQLISAVYSAISYAQKGDSLLQKALVADTLALSVDDDEILAAQITESADTVVMAPIIPTNIEADIDINAKNGYYADMKLSDLQGCLQIHEGALRINDLSTNSDAGALKFNALYAARNKDDIHAAFDLDMTDIRIDRFIRLIPEVDSIMPLLKEMEGIIDANITASTQVDSAFNVIFPTISAAMKIHGDSLVLLDSETFAKISKMLMFKNKKRNMIDNMDVELLISDNNLELFTFTFEMDRYKVWVMGSND